MRNARHNLVHRLAGSPYSRPGLGMASGPVLAALALVLDSAVGTGAGPAAGNARVLLGSVIGGTITVTALVFWVRGMFVQLAAAQLPPRVVRWHLDDTFLQWTIAVILSAFGYACVVLLAVPAQATARAPTIAVAGAVILTATSLLAVVVTITDSMRNTDESHVLASLTREATAAVRRRFPTEIGRSPATDPVEPPADGTVSTIVAASSGWLNTIEPDALLAAVPGQHDLVVKVASGTFVAVGGVLATLHGEGADERTVQRIGDAFRIDPHRDPRTDVHFALGRLVDVALEQFGGTSPSGGHEALMHIGLVLQEAFRREVSEPAWTGEDGRRVEWRAGLSHQDLLAEVLRPLHESGVITSPVAVTLLRALGVVARDVRRRGMDGDRLRLLQREAGRVLESLAYDEGAWGPTEDPRQVAAEEGLVPEWQGGCRGAGEAMSRPLHQQETMDGQGSGPALRGSPDREDV